MILALVLCTGLIQSPTVKPGGTLGQQRMRFYTAVQERMLDEFDEETLGEMGESGAWAHIMFPTGSADRMYFFEHHGDSVNRVLQTVRCRLRGFQVVDGKVRELFSVDLMQTKGFEMPGAGPLEKFLVKDQPRFCIPAKRSDDLKKALQDYRPLASYSFQKIGGLVVNFISVAGIEKMEDGVGWSKGAFPLSRFEKKPS